MLTAKKPKKKPGRGRYVLLFLTFIALPVLAESRHDKDVRECRKAPLVMKHPAKVKEARQEAFNACMASKGYAVGKIRAK